MATKLISREVVGELKTQQNAVILAHHYQDGEIQEVADLVGDTLELALAGQRYSEKNIVFCGAKFMAETVKILNPAATVVLPDLNAACSLVDSCPAAAIRAFRQRNPKHVVVAYLHTSAEVKAESDIVCTAQNAVAVVNSIPSAKPILFVPDSNLGRYVQEKTGRRNMQIWQGACIVHATFAARRLVEMKAQHPAALVAAHPECPANVLQMAHFTGSSSEIVEWCAGRPEGEFILATDSGLRYALEKRAPGRRFYFAASEGCNCSECPYLRVNTLEKLAACLETLAPRIELTDEVVRHARLAIDKMLAVH